MVGLFDGAGGAQGFGVGRDHAGHALGDRLGDDGAVVAVKAAQLVGLDRFPLGIGDVVLRRIAGQQVVHAGLQVGAGLAVQSNRAI